MRVNRLLLLSCLIPTLLMASPLPEPVFPQPVMIQLQSRDFNIETIDRIHAMGFRGFRRGLYWSAIDKGEGVYDFSEWDAEFKHAHEKGMRIIGCLFGNNKLYEDDPGVGGIQTEAGRVAFAKFAAAAMEHYRDYDILWEIWTEPNTRTFWRKNKTAVGDVPAAMHNSLAFAEEYTSLVKEIARQGLEKNPDAFIVAGSVSNFWKPSYEWTELCFQLGILDCGIRGWSVHPYGVKTPEAFDEGYEVTRSLLAKYGKPGFPVLNTERGFSVGAHSGGGEVANEGWSGGPTDLALTIQAWHLVRMFMMDQMNGVPVTSWYQLSEDKFGLLPGRPATAAATVMATQLDGYRYVKRLPSDDPLDYVLLWENREGAAKLVAWTSPPIGSAPDQARNHHVTVGGLAGDLPVVDIAGGLATVSGDPVVLPLTASPVYIVIPAGRIPGPVKVVEGSFQTP